MKKKILVLVAVLAGLAFTAYSAGSSEAPTSQGKVKITFWGLFSGGDGDIIKSMVSKFNAESKSVEVEMLSLKSEEYYTKLLTALTSNTAPDLAISHISRIPEFVEDGLIIGLDDLAKGAGFKYEEINPRLAKTAAINGNHYAVPLDTHLLLMYHNTKILGEIGMLDANKQAKLGIGKDAFLQYYSDVKAKLPADKMPISGTSKGGLPMYVWYTLLAQAGGGIFGADGKTVTLVSEPNRKALSFIAEMNQKEIWPKNQKSGSEIFSAGAAASTFNGNWGLPIFETRPGLEFAAIPFPQVFEAKAVYADSHTFVFPKKAKSNTPQQKAAMTFAKWMVDNGLLWAKAGHVPSKLSVIDSAEYKAMPYRSSYAKSAEWAAFFPASTITVGIIDVVQRHLASLVNGELTVDQTMAAMQKDIEALRK